MYCSGNSNYSIRTVFIFGCAIEHRQWKRHYLVQSLWGRHRDKMPLRYNVSFSKINFTFIFKIAIRQNLRGWVGSISLLIYMRLRNWKGGQLRGNSIFYMCKLKKNVCCEKTAPPPPPHPMARASQPVVSGYSSYKAIWLFLSS